jgi:betaine-homocysteine S-methyltransferase
LEDGPVICAEGYLFELEKRGYVQVGPFVPEVVLDYPSAVKELHREFLLAGSDIIEAFTYYGHREKMRLVGKEHLVKELNVKALQLAKEVAAEGNALFAGNICNTNIWIVDDPATHEEARLMFREQVEWAKESGVDLIIAETFDSYGEALCALEEIKRHSIPAVVTFTTLKIKNGLHDGVSLVEACKRLKEAGADVVGYNCARGPATLIPLLKELRAAISGPIAALPVPFRTNDERPTFQNLGPLEHCYTELEPHLLTRYEVADYTRQLKEIGVNYFGLCCGNSPYLTRAMAEALGRNPPASKFSADLSKHFALGNKPEFHQQHQAAWKEF